ncbi:MAG TPA: transposase domain-containing protein [Clostridiales bacterium]|nr:transposase domain-containing protein [Clostridiales bacterium]
MSLFKHLNSDKYIVTNEEFQWLFANTEAGARAVSIIFSIIETAKSNFLKPYKYLNWLFHRIRAVVFHRLLSRKFLY